jgi:hypothetical protein
LFIIFGEYNTGSEEKTCLQKKKKKKKKKIKN